MIPQGARPDERRSASIYGTISAVIEQRMCVSHDGSLAAVPVPPPLNLTTYVV